jgi:hypothetical protein
MLRVGDDTAGFSVDFTSTGGIVVSGWGFWDPQVAVAFAASVLEACREQRPGATLTLDMSELKPMREEGQQSFSHVLRSLQKLGISQTSIVTTNPLAKLQLVRLATESGTYSAIQWINATNRLGRGI